jgi:hypothetical protein
VWETSEIPRRLLKDPAIAGNGWLFGDVYFNVRLGDETSRVLQTLVTQTLRKVLQRALLICQTVLQLRFVALAQMPIATEFQPDAARLTPEQLRVCGEEPFSGFTGHLDFEETLLFWGPCSPAY